MPELPEVQTTVNGINKLAKGLMIENVWTDYGGSIHIGKDNIKDPAYFKQFLTSIQHKKIVRASRRGKNILIHLSDNLTILIHMKMTGHMMLGNYQFDSKKQKDPWSPIAHTGPLADPFNKFIHLVFTLSDGRHLVLSDMRKFAKVTLIETDKLMISSHLKDIGPEPLEKDFTFDIFRERILLPRSGRIKNILMSPEIIAGVGNIYSDEALWLAGIHPESNPHQIPIDLQKKLYVSVQEVLRKGIDFGGDSMSDYRNIDGERGAFQGQHNAYRKTKTKCTKQGCLGIIIRKVVGGRSAHFCDTHQKLFTTYVAA